MLERFGRRCLGRDSPVCSKVVTFLYRILRWLGIAVGVLLAVILLLFAAAWLINLHDESLTPQAQALLQIPPNPYKPEDNIYLALMGFDAPSGQSVITDGQSRVDYYDQHLDAVLRDPSADAIASLTVKDPRRLQFKGNCDFLHPLDSSVWSEVPQHRDEIQKLMADNLELYQRYLGLLSLRGYFETARPSYVTPFPMWASETRKLFLADLVLRMRSEVPASQSRTALTDLESDVQTWRTVLRGQGALISKMIAINNLQGDYLVVADMIADPRLALSLSEQDADSLVPPPDLKDWDIGTALAGEFRMSSSVLRQTNELASMNWVSEGQARSGVRGWLNRLSDRIGRHFYKLNATENVFAVRTARQIQAAADPVQLFGTQNESVTPPPGNGGLWNQRLIYNPVGKILAAVSDGAYDNYALRAWDGAALQRLVRLGYEIHRQRIQSAGIPAFLQQHPEVATHPADHRPFVWDPQRAEIRVQTVAKQRAGRRFSIRVWQPALAASAAPR
jgi:hypothetical protein